MKPIPLGLVCSCLLATAFGLSIPFLSSKNKTTESNDTTKTSYLTYLKNIASGADNSSSLFSMSSLLGLSENSSLFDSFPKLHLNFSLSSVKAAPEPDPSQLAEGCYDELGCFENVKPWRTLLRPFPKPMSPKAIDTKIYLYTSGEPKNRYPVKLWDKISLEDSDYDANRSYTAFITHGFSSNGNASWVEDLKDAYLKNRDANVFIVDWGNGANHWNYLQVAANTRVVGAEVGRFGQYLTNYTGLDPSRMHVMGHSLGAHISAYLAKAVPGVAELTAFDPAQPGFEGCADEVRLTKKDAEFVSAIHTNTRLTIPFLGFGLIFPTGDSDYYMNGGMVQPGCYLPPHDEIKLSSLADYAKFSVEMISGWVACSHGKSYLYYTEALANDNCTYWGKHAGAFGTLANIVTLGRSAKLVEKYGSCTLETCSPIGLNSKDYPARGIFLAGTHSSSPYCQSNVKVTETMEQLRARQLENERLGITTTQKPSKFSKLKNLFG